MAGVARVLGLFGEVTDQVEAEAAEAEQVVGRGRALGGEGLGEGLPAADGLVERGLLELKQRLGT